MRQARVARWREGVGRLAFSEPFQASGRVVRACCERELFSVTKVDLWRKQETRSQPNPPAQTPRWRSHRERKEKSGSLLRHLYREPAESTEANFHFPLMIDLVPDSFQHEAFCSLFMVIARVNLLIRSVGATFRTLGHRFAWYQGSHMQGKGS